MSMSMYACWRKCIGNALADMLQLDIKQKVKVLQQSQ